MILVTLAIFLSGVVFSVLALRYVMRGDRSERRIPEQTMWLGLAVAAALAPGLALLFVPIYASSRTVFDASGQSIVSGGSTLLDVEGLGALIPLAIPALVAAIPFLARRTATRSLLAAISATLLGAFSTLAGFSIGLFYMPSGALMLLAAATGVAGMRGYARVSDALTRT